MPTATKPVSWQTAKRLRAHGTILLLCLWSLYLWTLGTPGLRDRNGNLKGTDFLHFYTLGSLARDHRGADLYDMNAQAALAAERVPEAAGIRYLPMYPPQVSILFAPFARLSYFWALSLWWMCSAAIYGACCYVLWRASPNLRAHSGLVALLAFANPAFFHLIAWGQTSALALLCFTLMFFCLRGKREFLAGLMLGCLIFKPQLGLAAAVVFLVLGAWKILSAAALSSALQLTIGILYYGIDPLGKWISTLWRVGDALPLLEPKPYQTYSLRTFWSMIVPWAHLSFALYVASAIAVLALAVLCWKRSTSAPLEWRYSALLLATLLVAPHLTVYDLVILVPVLILVADRRTAQQPSAATRTGTLLYLVYTLPLLGPLARWTHIQLAVIAMGVLLYAIWKSAAASDIRTGTTAPQENVEPTRLHDASRPLQS